MILPAIIALLVVHMCRNLFFFFGFLGKTWYSFLFKNLAFLHGSIFIHGHITPCNQPFVFSLVSLAYSFSFPQRHALLVLFLCVILNFLAGFKFTFLLICTGYPLFIRCVMYLGMNVISSAASTSLFSLFFFFFLFFQRIQVRQARISIYVMGFRL